MDNKFETSQSQLIFPAKRKLRTAKVSHEALPKILK